MPYQRHEFPFLHLGHFTPAVLCIWIYWTQALQMLLTYIVHTFTHSLYDFLRRWKRSKWTIWWQNTQDTKYIIINFQILRSLVSHTCEPKVQVYSNWHQWEGTIITWSSQINSSGCASPTHLLFKLFLCKSQPMRRKFILMQGESQKSLF